MATSGIVRPNHPRPDTFLWRWKTRDNLLFWDVNVAVLAKGLKTVYSPNGHFDHSGTDELTIPETTDRPSEIISTTITTNSTTKPVAAGDGKTRTLHPEPGDLSFARDFGLAWSATHDRSTIYR